MRFYSHLLLFVASLGLVADQLPVTPPAKVSPFPELPAVAPVTPLTPKVDPAAAIKLTTGTAMIVKHDTPFTLRASPTGIVNITRKAGPLSIYANIVGGKGEADFYDLPEKFVAIVTPMKDEKGKGKSGRVELIYSPVGAVDESGDVRRMVDVNTAPIPPPVPPVPPKPDPVPPKPDPVPTTLMGKGGFVCIVEETADLATERRLTFTHAGLNAYMTAQNHKWRIVDQNVRKPNSMDPPDDIVRFLAASKGKPLPQVFLCNSKGEIVLQGNLPNNGADLLALVKKAGG